MAAALAALADFEAREQYERVRATYNSIRTPRFSPLPPFEEWQGVHLFCNNPICRYTVLSLMLTCLLVEIARLYSGAHISISISPPSFTRMQMGVNVPVQYHHVLFSCSLRITPINVRNGWTKPTETHPEADNGIYNYTVAFYIYFVYKISIIMKEGFKLSSFSETY